MPDMTVHNSMGDRVLKKLPREIAEQIDSDAFHVGTLGPDPYFFYRFFALPFTHGVDGRGKIMHHKRCGAFLMELARECGVCSAADRAATVSRAAADNAEDQAADNVPAYGANVAESQAAEVDNVPAAGFADEHARRAFSYFAGFLCHYSLDSTVHPFVNAIAARRPGIHTVVERKLERIELARQGKEPKDIMRLFRQYPDLPEIRRAMKAVYGWDDDLFRTGYRHMKAFHWVVKDQHGWFAKLVGGKPVPMVVEPAAALANALKAQGLTPEALEKSIKALIKPVEPVIKPMEPVINSGGQVIKSTTNKTSGVFNGLRHRVLQKIAGKNYWMLCAVSYRNHLGDKLDVTGFDELERVAVDMAVRLITAAYDCRCGRISEDELAAAIGNRAYSGGIAEE